MASMRKAWRPLAGAALCRRTTEILTSLPLKSKFHLLRSGRFRTG
jgi:hypothetical protein